VWIIHAPFSFTGQNNFLIIFLSHIAKVFASLAEHTASQVADMRLYDSAMSFHTCAAYSVLDMLWPWRKLWAPTE
jgi:hypothetical protein